MCDTLKRMCGTLKRVCDTLKRMCGTLKRVVLSLKMVVWYQSLCSIFTNADYYYGIGTENGAYEKSWCYECD